MTTNGQIGQKVWSYCNVLRDAGLSYGDYLEQITYLVFLKMMDERSQPPYTDMPGYEPPAIPESYTWQRLVALDGTELELHYRNTLEALGRERGALGLIFRKAQNEIHDPAMLRRLVAEPRRFGELVCDDERREGQHLRGVCWSATHRT